MNLGFVLFGRELQQRKLVLQRGTFGRFFDFLAGRRFRFLRFVLFVRKQPGYGLNEALPPLAIFRLLLGRVTLQFTSQNHPLVINHHHLGHQQEVEGSD